MAQTAADICNLALLRIGQRAFLDSLDGQDLASRTSKVLYTVARDSVLASAPWPFATRRVTLAALDGVERSGWSYVFAYPSDCLSVRGIVVGFRVPTLEQRGAYAIHLDDDGTGKVIVADGSAVELEYTARVESVGLFSPLFVDALAWKLAADLAPALAGKPEMIDMATRNFEFALARALAADFNQRHDLEPESELITSRG